MITQPWKVGYEYLHKVKHVKTNRIYHYAFEETRESHPSVHDLQSTTRFAELSMS